MSVIAGDLSDTPEDNSSFPETSDLVICEEVSKSRDLLRGFLIVFWSLMSAVLEIEEDEGLVAWSFCSLSYVKIWKRIRILKPWRRVWI
jgi:hypothetical protein